VATPAATTRVPADSANPEIQERPTVASEECIKGMSMFGELEFHGAPPPTAPNGQQPAARMRGRYRAPGQAPKAGANRNVPMLGGVRLMLGLAVEGAFDLRTGHANSDHLRLFDEMLDRQTGLLDGLKSEEFISDPGLLTRRAKQALDGFAAAVRQEIVEYVRPGIDPGAFDAALRRMTDVAVLAGVAFASLDLALDHPL